MSDLIPIPKLKTLVVIDGDYYRADLIAAIVTCENDVHVWLEGFNEPFEYMFDDRQQAEAAQVKAVKAWLDQLQFV